MSLRRTLAGQLSLGSGSGRGATDRSSDAGLPLGTSAVHNRGVQSSDDRHQHILNATWTVLQRSGFEGLKVRSVLREAGVSARTFYEEFSDKDELFLALLREEMARAAPRIRAVVDLADGPVEKVGAWIKAVISAGSDPKRAARARLFGSLQQITRRFSVEYAVGRDSLTAPLLEAIVAGHREGIFPWADPAADTLFIYELTGGLLSEVALASPLLEPTDVVARDASRFVLRALGLPPDNLPA